MLKISTEKELLAFLAKTPRAVVLFHTTWCPFSRAFFPAFSAEKMPGWEKLEVLLDDYDNPVWEKYAIEVVPSVLFFKKGKVILRLDSVAGVGLRPAQLCEAFEKVNNL